MKLFKQTDLPQLYPEVILPFFEKNVSRGIWKMPDGVDICYYNVVHPNAKGVVVLSTGRIESARKYAELIHDFFVNGYSVFIHDHRGQGESDRMSDNPHHGYVRDFNDYVDDFRVMIADVISPWLSENEQARLPRFLICHSMGGAIGFLLLLQEKTFFQKAVFCSPMFGIAPPIPIFLAKILLNISLKVSKIRGKAASYFFGSGDYVTVTFDKNRLMQSQQRYQIFIEEYSKHPQLQLGGVTSQWIFTSLQALETIMASAHALMIPTLCLQSGDDTVVSNEAIDQVVANIPDVRFKQIKGAMHELLFESDELREIAISTIDDFISK